MPLVINRQRKVKLDTRDFLDFAEKLAAIIETDLRDFTVVFSTDSRIRDLNKEFRGNDSPTDVLSFPMEPEDFEFEESELGDIVISVEQAKKQAEENGLTLENEIKQLILHGALHLCGYDHETDKGEMNARELELREHLGI